MKTTTIRRVHDPVPLVENTTRTVWDRADRVSIDRFLWTSPRTATADHCPDAVQ